MEFVFAPEARDVYSYEGLAQTLDPLGAKPGQNDCPYNRKDSCAPAELSS